MASFPKHSVYLLNLLINSYLGLAFKEIMGIFSKTLKFYLQPISSPLVAPHKYAWTTALKKMPKYLLIVSVIYWSVPRFCTRFSLSKADFKNMRIKVRSTYGSTCDNGRGKTKLLLNKVVTYILISWLRIAITAS